jgi:hypothetical protein
MTHRTHKENRTESQETITVQISLLWSVCFETGHIEIGHASAIYIPANGIIAIAVVK